MYTVITYTAGVLYSALTAAGGVLIVVASARRASDNRRATHAIVMMIAAAAVMLTLALVALVTGERLDATLAAVCALATVALAALNRRAYIRYRDRRIRMSPPASLEAYLARFDLNVGVTWGGPGDQVATVHMPCPFCAAADFAVYPVGPDTAQDTTAALGTHYACGECGRAARFLVCYAEAGRWCYRVLQTAGPARPTWLAAGRTTTGR